MLSNRITVSKISRRSRGSLMNKLKENYYIGVMPFPLNFNSNLFINAFYTIYESIWCNWDKFYM